MRNRSAITSWISFVVFILIAVFFVRWQADEDVMFVNETLALTLLCVGFPFKIYKVKVATYIIFLMLLILLFQPLTYSYVVSEGNTTISHGSTRFNTVISPIVLLVLICHLIINYASMIDLYHLLVRGSAKEQDENRKKAVDFYYDKFSACSDIELKDIFKLYSEYPVEAQEALKRVKSEKEIG